MTTMTERTVTETVNLPAGTYFIGIIPPGLHQPEPSQMEKYIADFVDENTHPQLDTADWEAAI